MHESDWKRLEALTDAEIDAALAEDPDAAVPSADDAAFWSAEQWTGVMPGQRPLTVPVRAKTLDILNAHHVSLVPVIQNILEAMAAGYGKEGA